MACFERGICMKRFRRNVYLFLMCLILAGTNVYAEELSQDMQDEIVTDENVITETQNGKIQMDSNTAVVQSAPRTNATPMSASSDVIADSIVIEEVSNGIYNISLRILEGNENIRGVRFAVWSELNGQDDLKWYLATGNQSDYVIQWDIREHKELGAYKIEAYADTTSGEETCIQRATYEVVQPKIENVAIDVNNKEGIATLTIPDVMESNKIQILQAAVWSESSGQDDLRWYTVNGNKQIIDIENHLYETGNYIVDFYITDITGHKYFAGKTSFKFQFQKGTLNIEKITSTDYKIELKDIQIPGGVHKVQFPVWSLKNAQDDIKWYTAKEIETGVYSAQISVKDHKSLGEYEIDAYAYSSEGQLIYLTKDQFVIEGPSVEAVSVEDDVFNTEKEGKFRVILSGVKNREMIRKLQVPVWNEENGQDDIVWYDVQEFSDGVYCVDIDIKNHKYSYGRYKIDVYCTDITGDCYFWGGTTKDINVEKGHLVVDRNSEKEYTVTLSGINVPGGVEKIQFPVWSDVNGQDDIKWYTAQKKLNGDYTYQISLKNHKGLGNFSIHAYAVVPNGKQIYLGKTNFTTPVPNIGKLNVEEIDRTEGKFQIVISEVENADLIEKIQVPVWADPNQKDIIWYIAKRNLDGNYVVDVDISNHGYRCDQYQIHVYMTDITGLMSFEQNTTYDLSPEYSNIEAIDVDGSEQFYEVTLKGLKVPGGEKGVRFAVWGAENGQNDVKWYDAEYQGEGTYTYRIKITDHCELGTYEVDAYCCTKKEVLQYIGKTSFELKIKPVISEVAVSDINGTTGTFTIKISGVLAPSGINKVEVPIWRDDDQNDIKWYTAIKISEGIYQINAKVSNHKHHFGDYHADVYVTMGNGVRKFVDKTTITISPLNYIYNNYVSPTQREVIVLGVNAESVEFPTWSDVGGQDDLIWYKGNNCGNGQWNVIIDSKNHSAGGNYTTDVYITSNGQKAYVGKANYSLQWIPTDQALMNNRANLYSSTTPFLILVNRSTHKVGIYQGWQGNWSCIQYWDCSDGAPSTPTVEGIFKVGIRGHHFFSGSSVCYWYTQFYGNYLFHSVLYNRYNNGATLVDGRLGMALSHGCVRLDINNAKWIYDTIPTGTTVVVYH